MLTNYGATLYGGFLWGESATPAELWLALLKDTPTAASTGSTIVEPVPADYDRVRVDLLTWNAVVSDGSEIRSLADLIEYYPAADWGTVSYYGICDASTAGNMILWGMMPSALTCSTGRRIVIPANSISLQAV